MTAKKKAVRMVVLAAAALGLTVGLIRLGMDAPTPPETGSTNTGYSAEHTAVSSFTEADTPPASTAPAQARTWSPAWIEARTRVVGPREPLTGGLAEVKEHLSYFQNNPNDWSTPMGALCWANHELKRTLYMRSARWQLDYRLMPHVLSIAEIDSEDYLTEPAESYWDQYGLAATEAAISVLARATGRPATRSALETTATTGLFAADYIKTSDVEYLRLYHEYGGNGTEWLDAIDAVAGASWNNAARTGDELPAAVRVYADSLAYLAWEQATNYAPYLTHRMLTNLPGYDEFAEAAKYDHDCKRAALTEAARESPPDDWADARTTTTTTFPAGPVPVEGAELNGVLTPAQSNISIGYFAKSGIGQLTDDTFTYQGTAYRIEQIYWRPNGTLRVDIHPDGLDDTLPDSAEITIEPLSNPDRTFTATAGSAWHLPPYIDFIWDIPLELEEGQRYRIELRLDP